MCGIAGIAALDAKTALSPAAKRQVKAMTDSMAYRGPDGEGVELMGSVCLGHRRLSIIDLAGGAQPMQDAAGQLAIVFNGEIYNFKDIRKELEARGARFQTRSDTEVVLEAYRVWGTDCLARFDGMFAFALWDSQARRLFCARDRFGKKPFFYTVQQGRLVFASELGCLRQIPELAFTLDPSRATSPTSTCPALPPCSGRPASFRRPTPWCLSKEASRSSAGGTCPRLQTRGRTSMRPCRPCAASCRRP